MYHTSNLWSRERKVCGIMKTSESFTVNHPGQSRTVQFLIKQQWIWKEDRGQRKEQISVFRCTRPRSESRFRMPTSAVYVPTFISENLGFASVFSSSSLWRYPVVFAMGHKKNSWHCFLNAIILYFLSRMPDMVGLFFCGPSSGIQADSLLHIRHALELNA